MLSVSEKYSQAINADSRDMPYRVTLAGAIVLDQNKVTRMTLEESVSNSSGVSLGTSNSATLRLTIKEADILDYNEVLVEPESGLVLPDGTIEWVPLGKFWVTDFYTSNDYKTLELTCADGMYHLTDTYVSELTYPTTIRAMMAEISGKTGVAFVGMDFLPNIEVRKKPDEMTFREAVGHIAGCCGCNARFDRLGRLEFVWYTDTGAKIERTTQYLGGMTKLNHIPLEVNIEVTGRQETYTVSVVSDGNGGVTATPGSNVLEGETVVVSINPFVGYELANISAVTDSGDDVTLYMASEGGRTFIQPDSNVTITASFRKVDSDSFTLTVRAYDGGSIRSNKKEYAEGDTATIYIASDEGYEFDKFVTTPADLALTRLGTTSNGETMYEFTIPRSDVTINAYFKAETVYYTINRVVDYGSFADSPGAIYIQEVGTREFIWQAKEGTLVGVTFVAEDGFVLDYYESSVELMQSSETSYMFTMPAKEVSIVAHYKLSEDESKAGKYSWLQKPQAAPTNKPYWAVFYRDSETLPTCQKYYLIWFDSWKATGYDTYYGEREYSIRFEGYYYCGSKNNGHGGHEWDTSSWSGNGASGSTLEWDACVDFMFSGNSNYGPQSRYCLLASNIHLFHNDTLLMEKCENAIQEPQTDYVQNGMDVRERGSLTYWKCPDTFSTPLPASNWMILMPESGLYMTVNEDGKYETPISSSPSTMIAFFYDDITIHNLGAIFSDALVNATDEEVYLASFTNGRWAYIASDGSSWGTLHNLPEGAVIGFRNPLVTTVAGSGRIDGNSYNFAGILATSKTLYADGSVFMYGNACRICDCATATSEVSTFSLRRAIISDAIEIDSKAISVTTEGDAISISSGMISAEVDGDSIVMNVTNSTPVTISYTNPIIYEKMVDAVSSLVQGVTYTPAKVKHRGNPSFQAGDMVQVPDSDGVYHNVLIMQQTMTFGGGMNSEIQCPGQTEKTKSFSSNSPMASQIKNEVALSSLELERRLSANNALVFASLYKTIDSSEAKIRSVVEWQTEKAAAISELEQTVSEYEATFAALTEWQSETDTSIANLGTRVSSNEAEFTALTQWKNATTNSISSLQTTATNNDSKFQAITEWQSATDTSIADLGTRVSSNEAEFTALAQWKNATTNSISSLQTTATNNESKFQAITEWQSATDTSIANLGTRVSSNEAEFTALAQWKNATTNSISSLQTTATNNESKFQAITEWQSETGTSIASIEQTVKNNKAAISERVAVGDVVAQFLLEVNDRYGESSSKAFLSADYIEFEGQKLNIKVDAVNIDGTLSVDQIISTNGIIRGYDGATSNTATNGLCLTKSGYFVAVSNNGAALKKHQGTTEEGDIVSQMYISGTNSGIRSWNSITIETGKTDVDTGGKVSSNGSININAGSGGAITFTGSTNNSSDSRFKENISKNLEAYESFYLDLKPASYNFIGSKNGTVFGYIAQDVRDSLEAHGIESGLISESWSEADKENRYFLNYNSFIALNTYMIQRLYKRIETLENLLKEKE